jgi:hypothetical protein
MNRSMTNDKARPEMNTLWGLWITGMTLIMVPLAVEAACSTSDLAGRWDAYSVGVDDGDPFWTRCSVRFNSAARILSGNSCINDTNGTSTLSGQFRVNTSCRITGPFTQQFDDGSIRCSIRATLAIDGEIVSGVGKCNDGAIFSFNMVKR